MVHYFTKHSNLMLQNIPCTLIFPLGSIIPLFGLTQYRFGAVVFTLKHTRLPDGFVNLRSDITTSLKGPEKYKS